MKTIGLTGGIGSGKSTVAGFFQELGVPVYIADEAGKEIMETSETAKAEIIALLGEKSYQNNAPDRPYIATKVFNHHALLKKLNAIVHPKVREHFKTWAAEQKAPYVLYEAAILFENGGEKKCDFTILVTAPKEIRIERLLKRDRSDRQKIEARMNAQWSDEKKRKLADFTIENLDIEATKQSVRQLHHKLLRLITA